MRQALFWIALNGFFVWVDVVDGSALAAAFNGLVVGLWVCELANDWKDGRLGRAA